MHTIETSGADISPLMAALAEAKREIPPIPKNKTAKVPTKSGGSYSYRYADLSDIMQACEPVLAKHGLMILQLITGSSAPGDTRIGVSTMLVLKEGGDWIRSIHWSEQGDTPQDTGAVITYHRRYGYCGMLGIQPDEDVDAQGAHYSAPQQASRPAPRAETAAPAKPAAQAPRAATAAMLAAQDGAPPWWREKVGMGKRVLHDIDGSEKPVKELTWEAMSKGSIGGGRHQHLVFMAKGDNSWVEKLDMDEKGKQRMRAKSDECAERAAFVISHYYTAPEETPF